MEQKDLLGLMLFVPAICGGVVAACISQRVRDACFLGLVVLSPMTERLDINFVSRDWYRGTTRGFELSLIDVLSISLFVSGLLMLRRGEKRFWPPCLGLLLAFFLYACFNVAMADPKIFGLFEISKLLRGLIVFMGVAWFVRSEREVRLLIVGLAAIVCYEGLSALWQRYGQGVHRVFGTVDDSNSLSIFFCTTAPVCIAALNSRIPIWLKGLCAGAVALACVGVILTISRTGVTTLAMVSLLVTLATVSIRITPKKIIIALVVLLGAAGVTVKSWKTLKSRFEESNLKQEYGNTRTLGRGYYIRIAEAIAAERPFGVGLNNWSYWVSNKYGPKLGYRFVPYKGTDKEPSEVVPPGSNVDMAQAAPAHSLGALTLGEMGIPGLILLLLLWMRWFQMGASFLWRRTPDPMRRIGVGLLFGTCGIFLQSITEWVFRQSPIYFTFHILLGVLASLYFIKQRAARPVQAAQAESEFYDEYAPARS